MPRIGIYAGSFDPFHKGHQSLLEDASGLFDSIKVLIACNSDKPARKFSTRMTLGMVCDFIGDRDVFEPGFMNASASPGKLAQDIGGNLIRGIRDITDMDYERRLATFNRELFGVQTVFLMARPELAHVNSTAIRELMRLGLGYGRYL